MSWSEQIKVKRPGTYKPLFAYRQPSELSQMIINALEAGYSLFDVCFALKKSYREVLKIYDENYTYRRGRVSDSRPSEDTGVKKGALVGVAKSKYGQLYQCRKKESSQ